MPIVLDPSTEASQWDGRRSAKQRSPEHNITTMTACGGGANLGSAILEHWF